ncbi:hypothetical protein BDQ17DRAFT_161212 [Cyathus striatus]|nr:hypothetical protein BDQ17DRAFT_161212 [Cyathus striatus]
MRIEKGISRLSVYGRCVRLILGLASQGSRRRGEWKAGGGHMDDARAITRVLFPRRSHGFLPLSQPHGTAAYRYLIWYCCGFDVVSTTYSRPVSTPLSLTLLWITSSQPAIWCGSVPALKTMRALRHLIIELYRVISTPTDIIFVLEYAGGELLNYIVVNERMPEPCARRFL